MFAPLAPLPLLPGQQAATPATTAAAATAAAEAAARGAAAPAAAAAAEGAAEPKAKAKAKAKAKVAKPLSKDTIHAVAQKWCGNVMTEVARARSTKDDLQKGSYGSELVTTLEQLAQEMMTFHQQIQSLLTEGNKEVDAYRAIMEKGDEVRKTLTREFHVAMAILKASNPKAKSKAKDKTKAKADPSS